MNDPAVELARQVLTVLALQQEYFRTRDTQKLQESKAAERRLKDACNAILHPKQDQPALFNKE